MNKIWYPNIERIISNNKLVLKKFPVSKADRFKLLSREKILKVSKGVRKIEGDIEDKAGYLFKELAIQHPFDSGNKRTAYFSANQFISKNKGYFIAKKRDKQKLFVHKIKHGEVSDKDISNWFR